VIGRRQNTRRLMSSTARPGPSLARYEVLTCCRRLRMLADGWSRS
jgi:hypothetical protein